MKRIVSTVVLFLVSLFAVQAAVQPTVYVPSNPPPVVKMAWDALPDQGITYHFYWGGQSRVYTNMVNVSTNFYVLSLPARGVNYFMAVTSVATNGLESTWSNEVLYTAPLPPSGTTLQPPIVLVVQSAPNPSGPFVNTGMSWSIFKDEGLFYRLNLAQNSPPVPLFTPLNLNPAKAPPIPR